MVCCEGWEVEFCQQLGLSGLLRQLGWLESHSLGEVSPEPYPRKMVRDILRDYAGARAGTGGVIAR